MENSEFNAPFTGPNTSWIITFEPGKGTPRQSMNFLIPYPKGTPEHEVAAWLNVTELEEECRNHMQSLENLEQLNETLIEVERQLHGDDHYDSENIDNIISHFQEILRRLMEERDE